MVVNGTVCLELGGVMESGTSPQPPGSPSRGEEDSAGKQEAEEAPPAVSMDEEDEDINITDEESEEEKAAVLKAALLQCTEKTETASEDQDAFPVCSPKSEKLCDVDVNFSKISPLTPEDDLRSRSPCVLSPAGEEAALERRLREDEDMDDEDEMDDEAEDQVRTTNFSIVEILKPDFGRGGRANINRRDLAFKSGAVTSHALLQNSRSPDPTPPQEKSREPSPPMGWPLGKSARELPELYRSAFQRLGMASGALGLNSRSGPPLRPTAYIPQPHHNFPSDRSPASNFVHELSRDFHQRLSQHHLHHHHHHHHLNQSPTKLASQASPRIGIAQDLDLSPTNLSLTDRHMLARNLHVSMSSPSSTSSISPKTPKPDLLQSHLYLDHNKNSNKPAKEKVTKEVLTERRGQPQKQEKPRASRRDEKEGSRGQDTSAVEPAKNGPLPQDGQGNVWPAWVYCTRYSDRPSSGPRSRKIKKRQKSEEEKRPRTAFTAEQLSSLKREFNENRYLTEERRQRLARELDLNESQIKIWFQNKRAKMKKSAGVKNALALQLMAQGLYNHSTLPVNDDDSDS